MSGRVLVDNVGFQRLKEAKRLAQEAKQRELASISSDEWEQAELRLKKISQGEGLPGRTFNRRSLEQYSLEI